MANSDYSLTGAGSFCTYVKLDKALTREDTEFTYAEFNFASIDAIKPGLAGLIGDEIVLVTAVAVRTFTVKRGCADTIPAEHPEGALCWMFSEATGTDGREYAAGQTIGVKVSPFTTGGGNYPLPQVAPDVVAFNWRFARPYPPAQMKVNNARWWNGAAVTEAQPNMLMSWVHRDRVLQANILIGHDDATIGPEFGTSYTMRMYDMTGTLRRTEVGLQNEQYNYQWPQIVNDFGYPSTPQVGRIEFTANRGELDSWQHYEWTFTVDPAGTLTSQYMNFDARMFEAPYRQNLINGLAPESNFFIGVAARPSDRMSDYVDFLGNVSAYAPWVTTDFRLPELEKTFNPRAFSFHDGVPIPLNIVGKLGLIDDEIVQIEAFDGTLTLRRGCLDTIPAVHLPGSRLWLFESGGSEDTTPRNGAVTAYFRPKVYGPPIPDNQLPIYGATTADRSKRPYPPAQIVVNGRPWFEEASSADGAPVYFSWARRNRLTQGADIYDHTIEDVTPEVGQVTRLTFFYTTPSTAPGQPAAVHVLRTIDLVGVTYAYTYDLALIDGQAAGIATGTCGTVVVSVKIESVRSGLTSWQSYTVPLRLPSYPCAG